MSLRSLPFLCLFALGGCAWFSDSQTFSVYFEPYSSDLDQQAQATIRSAASFARSHPLQMVSVAGFSAPPDPKRDVDGLSAKRADVVKQALVDDGLAEQRVMTVANGITDPKSLPTLAVRRVDISIGHGDAKEASAAEGGVK